MTPDVFAEWQRLQGHLVVRTASSYWHSQGPRAFQAFPYHWVIHPAEDELSGFLREEGAFALRYSTSLLAPLGCASYQVVYEKPTYGLDDLGKWARKNVRRGLRNCSVEPISFARLAQEGWDLQCDSQERQGRQVRESLGDWRRRCETAASLPGFEAWGALVSGRLGASVMTFTMGDWCYMLYQQCRREYLAAHVNNALSFVVTQTMIGRPTVRSVFYALQSLDAPPSMDEFKLRMGYTAKPVRQRVVFHPWISSLFNTITYRLVRSLRELRPGHPLLAKTEGMMRFYLEGKRPLHDQSVPQPLREMTELNDQP
jgi:hypothetical protein